jgi:putative membrane protein
MIDYVTLLLINMVSALVALAFFLWWGLDREDARHWAPAFGIPGLVATIAGFAMTFTAPIPKPFSMAYGEMSVLLGVLFLGAAWALTRGWSLLPLSIYAFFAGWAAIILGIRFIDLSLTPMAFLPGAGFILTGLGGVCAGFVLHMQSAKALRTVGGLVMLAAAALWVFTAYTAYWAHMKVEPATHTPASAAQPSRSHANATPRSPAVFGTSGEWRFQTPTVNNASVRA